MISFNKILQLLGLSPHLQGLPRPGEQAHVDRWHERQHAGPRVLSADSRAVPTPGVPSRLPEARLSGTAAAAQALPHLARRCISEVSTSRAGARRV